MWHAPQSESRGSTWTSPQDLFRWIWYIDGAGLRFIRIDENVASPLMIVRKTPGIS